MKKKNFSLIYLSVFLLLIIIVLILLFAVSYRSLRGDVKKSSINTLYGVVLETGKNYIKVRDTKSDDSYYLRYKNDNISVNDIVSIKYKDSIEDIEDIEIILNEDDKVYVVDTKPITTTFKASNKASSKTSKITSSLTNNTTSSTNDNSEDVIVNKFKESYNLVNSSNESTIGEKVKEKFIDIVDFILYGKEINGRTFESLTTSAKGKVVYYALLIDSKIDSKWPQYKETISGKYKDIKAKLIAKYLDLTTQACKSDEHTCENFKKDFNLLKSSLKLTWDVIKKAFSYAYDKTSNKIIEWYEVFSGKV